MRAAPFGRFLFAVSIATPKRWNGVFLGRLDVKGGRSFVLNWNREHRGWRTIRSGSGNYVVRDLGLLRLSMGRYGRRRAA